MKEFKETSEKSGLSIAATKNVIVVVIFGLITMMISIGIYKMAYVGSLIDGGMHACQSPITIGDFFWCWFLLWGAVSVFYFIKNLLVDLFCNKSI